MAGFDNKEQMKAQQPLHEPKVLGRREVLKGLSTVPALGLFGYAWQRQRQYQQSRVDEVIAAANAPAAGLQEINVALLGAGAQGQVLTDAMLRIPGLRFRAVCDVWTEYNQRRVVNSLKLEARLAMTFEVLHPLTGARIEQHTLAAGQSVNLRPLPLLIIKGRFH